MTTSMTSTESAKTTDDSAPRMPTKAYAPASIRWRTMVTIAWRMMFHSKLKMFGTLIGVVFAVILSNQQAGTFLGLIKKNTMFVEYCGADMWIVSPSTLTLQPTKPMGISSLYTARSTKGVAWAEPLLFAGASIQLPAGGSEPIQFVGTAALHCRLARENQERLVSVQRTRTFAGIERQHWLVGLAGMFVRPGFQTTLDWRDASSCTRMPTRSS